MDGGFKHDSENTSTGPPAEPRLPGKGTAFVFKSAVFVARSGEAAALSRKAASDNAPLAGHIFPKLLKSVGRTMLFLNFILGCLKSVQECSVFWNHPVTQSLILQVP